LPFLQELLAIQQSDGPKNLGFFGTRNMGMTHQKLVEILSYAMVSTVGGGAVDVCMSSRVVMGRRPAAQPSHTAGASSGPS
jgi:hypothetical protein